MTTKQEAPPADRPPDFAAMADRTAVVERALIVAWLRLEAAFAPLGTHNHVLLHGLARAIERGEHAQS